MSEQDGQLAEKMARPYGAWKPTQNAVDLKVLGKLCEESAELSSALARCIIQGIDEKEPTTGKVNRVWLQEEIADVLVNIQLTVEHFCLDEGFMSERIHSKLDKLQAWQQGE